MGEEGKELARELKRTAQGMGGNVEDLFQTLEKLGVSDDVIGRLRRMGERNKENLGTHAAALDDLGTAALRSAENTEKIMSWRQNRPG